MAASIMLALSPASATAHSASGPAGSSPRHPCRTTFPQTSPISASHGAIPPRGMLADVPQRLELRRHQLAAASQEVSAALKPLVPVEPGIVGHVMPVAGDAGDGSGQGRECRVAGYGPPAR